MRRLGEQWVEEIDGKKHMLKAVEPTFDRGSSFVCTECIFAMVEADYGVSCFHEYCKCPLDNHENKLTIKDLGPVNEDGLLPCPFCGEFPKGVSEGTEYSDNGGETDIFYIEHSCNVVQTTEFTYSEQQSKDAWNRRA